MAAASPLRNVMVIGGGGSVGPFVVRALNDEPTFRVSVLSRQSSKSTFPTGVRVHRIPDTDCPEDELVEAFRGQDAVVSTLGVASVLQQIPMIDAAVKAGVLRFLPAEFGGNKENAKVAAHPVFAGKQKVLEHLKRKSVENDAFRWTGVATGPFFDWGLKNGFLGFDLAAHKALIYDSGDVSWTATTLPTVGLAVARTLLKPEETKNKFVFVYSVRTTQNKILSALQDETAGEEQRWDVEYTTIEAAVQSGRERLSKGDMSGAVPLILSTMFQHGWGGDFTECGVETANRLLGLPEEALDDIVRNCYRGT